MLIGVVLGATIIANRPRLDGRFTRLAAMTTERHRTLIRGGKADTDSCVELPG